MQPPTPLPDNLQDWLRFWEARSGLRDLVDNARGNKSIQDVLGDASQNAQGACLRGMNKNTLGRYFGHVGYDQYGSLPVAGFEALLHVVGMKLSALQRGWSPPEIDYWRSGWIQEPTDWPYKGCRAVPLQPIAAKRVIDASRLDWEAEHNSRQWLIDPHACALVCLRGPITLEFFATHGETIDKGDLLLFDGAHPHRITAAAGTQAVLIRADPGRTCHPGVVSFLLEPKNFDKFKTQGILEWTAALRVSFALHRIDFSLVQGLDAPFRGRMIAFKKGRKPPDMGDLRKLARFLRLSDAYFYRLICPTEWRGFPVRSKCRIPFRPFRKVSAEDLQKACQKVPQPRIRQPQRRGHAHAAAFNGGSWTDQVLIASDAPGKKYRWSRLGRYAPGPTISAFCVHNNDVRLTLDDHHADDPGEAFHLIVNNSKLFFNAQNRDEFRKGTNANKTKGSFGQHDALWFTTQLAHTFGLNSDEAPQMIHVRWRTIPPGV